MCQKYSRFQMRVAKICQMGKIAFLLSVAGNIPITEKIWKKKVISCYNLVMCIKNSLLRIISASGFQCSLSCHIFFKNLVNLDFLLSFGWYQNKCVKATLTQCRDSWYKLTSWCIRWSLHWASVAFTQQFDSHQEFKENATFVLWKT